MPTITNVTITNSREVTLSSGPYFKLRAKELTINYTSNGVPRTVTKQLSAYVEFTDAYRKWKPVRPEYVLVNDDGDGRYTAVSNVPDNWLQPPAHRPVQDPLLGKRMVRVTPDGRPMPPGVSSLNPLVVRGTAKELRGFMLDAERLAWKPELWDIHKPSLYRDVHVALIALWGSYTEPDRKAG